jgi:hypothetical protein
MVRNEHSVLYQRSIDGPQMGGGRRISAVVSLGASLGHSHQVVQAFSNWHSQPGEGTHIQDQREGALC